MLTGHPPFAGRSPQVVMDMHRRVAPEPLGPRRPDAPSHLVAVVMKCLAKQPADRPKSGDEIANTLDPVTRARSNGGFTRLLDRTPMWVPWAFAIVSTIAAITLAMLMMSRGR
jgi:serine/threonine-protein kinase